ncbi:MAG: hypothetical protein KJZ84_10735 [Bryobacteraceae bacterium]|nr:hypothetical protein [Bryobacteraceae bacterium]
MRVASLFAVVLIALLAVPGVRAQRDFLTADEVDQLRITQEPDPRLRLYLKFAQQRVDLLEQLFSRPATGRSGMIHTTLGQLTQIIEAVDTVIDDTLRKGRELESIEFVAKENRKLLEKLNKFLDQEPPDLDRYQFAMENVIDTLEDSAEMAEEDLRMRRRSVAEREADDRKRRESMSTPERVKEAAETREKEAEQKKKRPSLLRKGETLPGKGGPPKK